MNKLGDYFVKISSRDDYFRYENHCLINNISYHTEPWHKQYSTDVYYGLEHEIPVCTAKVPLFYYTVSSFIDNYRFETPKKKFSIFHKDDYIVFTQTPEYASTTSFSPYYVFKQRQNHAYLRPYKDLHGKTLNGHTKYRAIYDTFWRFATKEEIAKYDRLDAPFIINKNLLEFPKNGQCDFIGDKLKNYLLSTGRTLFLDNNTGRNLMPIALGWNKTQYWKVYVSSNKVKYTWTFLKKVIDNNKNEFNNNIDKNLNKDENTKEKYNFNSETISESISRGERPNFDVKELGRRGEGLSESNRRRRKRNLSIKSPRRRRSEGLHPTPRRSKNITSSF